MKKSELVEAFKEALLDHQPTHADYVAFCSEVFSRLDYIELEIKRLRDSIKKVTKYDLVEVFGEKK